MKRVIIKFTDGTNACLQAEFFTVEDGNYLVYDSKYLLGIFKADAVSAIYIIEKGGANDGK